MRVTEARQIARDWIDAQVAAEIQIEAAFLHGSITWLDNGAVISPASDVDILVVPGSANDLPIRGKQVVDGLALDVSTINRSELEPVEKLLGTYHLAGSLRSSESILFDPGGWLSELQQTIAIEFARPEWVRRRCGHAFGRVQEYLAPLETVETLEERMISWLFAAGVATHVILVAGLRNPTVRNRYAALRSLLDELGHQEMYAPLVDLLDPGQTSAEVVSTLIDHLEQLFDVAMQTRETWFYFSDDISPVGKVGAIDSARELVRTGNHREALFWIGVTAARCMTILRVDGSDSVRTRFDRYLVDLSRIFGVEHSDSVKERIDSMHAFIPVLEQEVETLISERELQAKRP